MSNQTVRASHNQVWTSVRAARWRGYTYASAGIPWNEEFYSKLDHAEANSYERGRLYAVNILSTGVTPPAWKFGKIEPSNMLKAIIATVNLAGTALPNGKFEVGHHVFPRPNFIPTKHPNFAKRPTPSLEELGL